MKLSTRCRYGVRMMAALAESYERGPTYLKDIAKKEEISEKYLSHIVIPLRAAGLIISTRGAHGGYTLARSPGEITVYDIVDVLEGETCLVECVKNPSRCSRVSTCPTRDVWAVLTETIRETLHGITLASLIESGREKAENAVMSNI